MSDLLDIGCLLFILLLILCWCCKGKTKLFAIIITIAYYLIRSGILGKLITVDNQYSTNIDACTNTSAVVLLGAGTITDKIQEPSLTAYDRILKASEVYENYPQKIIVSGGYTSTDDKSEAQIYAKELLLLGVNKNDLILENNSTDTYQKAEFVKKIINKNTKPLCLITDSLHLQRSKVYFDNANINTVALASSTPSINLKFLPSSYNIYTTQRAAHEYFGILKAYIQTHI